MVNLCRRGYRYSVFFVACLFALAGCNSSASQAKSAATTKANSAPMFVANATPTTCVGTYTNAANTYHIACPTGWRVTSATVVPNGVALISPTNTTGVIISAVQGEMTASQYTPFLQSYLAKVGATGAKITQSEQQVTAGANTWTEKKATFTKNGTDFTVAQYATVHNGKTFFVEAIAPTANFTAAQSAFQAELASVKFT